MLDRLVDGKIATTGTAAEVSYLRASGRFEARDLRFRLRSPGRGELSVAAPAASGAADPRQGQLELRGGVTGTATSEGGVALAASKPGPGKPSGKGSPALPAGPEPIHYEADVLRTDGADPKARVVHLDGHVRFSKGDLVVTGARAVAELAPEGLVKSPVAGLGQFKRFTVDGGVHVERGGRTADGEHAVYDSEAQTLSLSGPVPAQGGAAASPGPLLRDGREQLTGERVVLLLDRDEVRVEALPVRVTPR